MEPRAIPEGVKRGTSKAAMREIMLDALEDVGELIADDASSMKKHMEHRQTLLRAWEEMDLGEAPELEISAKVVGLLEPRRERAS